MLSACSTTTERVGGSPPSDDGWKGGVKEWPTRLSARAQAHHLNDGWESKKNQHD